MRHHLLVIAFLCVSRFALAQGYNHDLGEDSLGGQQTLAHKLFNIEKKHEAFNVYVNYVASFQAADEGGRWESRFANRELRFEITGNINDRLSYRFRHQLNKSYTARGGDNFAKATDLAWIAYKLSDAWSVQAGKVCLTWGGFEYDENPIFIYRYSDFVDAMDIYMAGVGLSFKPQPAHEFIIQATNTYNGSFAEEWGSNPRAVGSDMQEMKPIEKSRNPLTLILNWNGSMLDNRLQTRWAWGVQTLARGKTGRLLTLGQQLNLPRLQWYVDYMGGWYDIDHLRFANNDAQQWYDMHADELREDSPDGAPADGFQPVMSHVRYHSLITKANWQFHPRWNLMLMGTCETVSAPRNPTFKDYRKGYVYSSAVEYFPVEGQNLRIFLAYIGQQTDYSRRCGLQDAHTNRVELGFIYRMKCF